MASMPGPLSSTLIVFSVTDTVMSRRTPASSQASRRLSISFLTRTSGDAQLDIDAVGILQHHAPQMDGQGSLTRPTFRSSPRHDLRPVRRSGWCAPPGCLRGMRTRQIQTLLGVERYLSRPGGRVDGRVDDRHPAAGPEAGSVTLRRVLAVFTRLGRYTVVARGCRMGGTNSGCCAQLIRPARASPCGVCCGPGSGGDSDSATGSKGVVQVLPLSRVTTTRTERSRMLVQIPQMVRPPLMIDANLREDRE